MQIYAQSIEKQYLVQKILICHFCDFFTIIVQFIIHYVHLIALMHEKTHILSNNVGLLGIYPNWTTKSRNQPRQRKPFGP